MCGNMATRFGLFRPSLGGIQQRNILPVHVHDINRHYCILLCLICTSEWPKNAEICSRITTCLYIITSDYNAAVGIYMISQTTSAGTNPQFHNTFRDMFYIYLQLLSVSWRCFLYS